MEIFSQMKSIIISILFSLNIIQFRAIYWLYNLYINLFIFLISFNKDKTSNKFNLYIFSIFSLLIFSESKKLNLISEITITIKGTGTQQILSNYTGYCTDREVDFQTLPDEIIINHEINHPVGKFVYDLVEDTNEITMKWINTPLIDCNGMF